MKKILFIIILGFLSSCKDNGPSPNNNGNGGAGSEYIIKGKLLNGTTMQPINPGLVMTLVVQNNGLQVKREELGSCKIQPDGSFELKYIHSQLAEIITAKMRFESQFYISEYLPKNRNLDTILYESSEGGGVIIVKDKVPLNRIYLAYLNFKDKYQFDSLVNDESKTIPFRYKNLKFGVYYDSIPIEYNENLERIMGNPKGISLDLKGDPFSDTLRIEY